VRERYRNPAQDCSLLHFFQGFLAGFIVCPLVGSYWPALGSTTRHVFGLRRGS
jgi:hypothetical protein